MHPLSCSTIAYQLLGDARGVPEQYKYLSVRLKTEQYRLLDWAQVAELAENDERLSLDNRQLVHDILHQTTNTLESFGKLDNKYKVLREPSLVDVDVEDDVRALTSGDSSTEAIRGKFPNLHTGMLSKCLRFRGTTGKFTKQVKFTVFHVEEYKGLLKRLAYFNGIMRSLLNDAQLNRLTEVSRQTSFEIMNLNTKMDNLLRFFAAGNMSFDTVKVETNLPFNPQGLLRSQSAMIFEEPLENRAEGLANLARVKAVHTGYGQGRGIIDPHTAQTLGLDDSVIDPSTTEIERARITFDVEQPKPIIGRQSSRSEAVLDEHLDTARRVWIEWKTYEPANAAENEPRPEVLNRVQQLAALLKMTKPKGFRAPDCLGYFRDLPKDDVHYRFGFVFAKPTKDKGVNASTKPICLLELFQKSKPSWTERVALATAIAQSIQYLHSVDWLHKGLRSHNIVFFPDADRGDKPIFSLPYLSGFDYARPYRVGEFTEKPAQDPTCDVYRHPSAHGDKPTEGFKKTFDIYALGILLVELAYWKPIHTIVGIKDLEKARPPETRAIYYKLLMREGYERDKNYLEKIRGKVGNRYHDAVRACLQGREALLEKDADEMELDRSHEDEIDRDLEMKQGAELQRNFNRMVVQELKEIIT